MTRLLLMLTLWAPPVFAGEAQPLATDPVAEARLKHLAVELRCLVCQNQTLADSNAPLAEDLRREVREMIAKGLSDQQIIDFLVERYGDFVLYRPPWRVTTTLLWVGPFLLLGGGTFMLIRTLVRRRPQPEDTPMTDEERQRLVRLLSQEGPRS